ncbi:hypothetical protein QYF36_009916 [Acer negundo]|nr:hypothetical protein QYF36_009916 [Acer negundo]
MRKEVKSRSTLMEEDLISSEEKLTSSDSFEERRSATSFLKVASGQPPSKSTRKSQASFNMKLPATSMRP